MGHFVPFIEKIKKNIIFFFSLVLSLFFDFDSTTTHCSAGPSPGRRSPEVTYT
jgi:hypothetical protein